MIAIAPTDFNWFTMLKSELITTEVNFWTPTPWNLKKLNLGDKLYFMLKSPYRKISGFGIFKYYENLSAKEAWNKYGYGNGVYSLKELIQRCQGYTFKNSLSFVNQVNPIIGCIVLKDLVYLDEQDYFAPETYGLTFPKQVVKIKYFECNDFEFVTPCIVNNPFYLVNEKKSDYTVSNLKARKGQSQFRQSVLNAYNHKCCITGESCADILQVAHIQPYINEESNHIQNGLPMRVDIHKLYDLGLIGISKDYRIKISPYLKSDTYLVYNNKTIFLPASKIHYPSKEALAYHNSTFFRFE